MDFTKYSPSIPALPNGHTDYSLSPEVLSKLVNDAFWKGYQLAKSIYEDKVDEPKNELPIEGYLGRV